MSSTCCEPDVISSVARWHANKLHTPVHTNKLHTPVHTAVFLKMNPWFRNK